MNLEVDSETPYIPISFVTETSSSYKFCGFLAYMNYSVNCKMFDLNNLQVREDSLTTTITILQLVVEVILSFQSTSVEDRLTNVITESSSTALKSTTTTQGIIYLVNPQVINTIV